jgi:hypothetical protein
MKKNMIRSSNMNIRKLYIVNDGTNDIDMLLVSCLLNPMDYKVVGGRCGDDEIKSIGVAYYEHCIDEVEMEVDGRPLWRVIDDLDYIDGTGKVDMTDMIFVAETDDGRYVQMDILTIRRMTWQEFAEVEEELEEEDEEEVDGNALLKAWQDYAKALRSENEESREGL